MEPVPCRWRVAQDPARKDGGEVLRERGQRSSALGVGHSGRQRTRERSVPHLRCGDLTAPVFIDNRSLAHGSTSPVHPSMIAGSRPSEAKGGRCGVKGISFSNVPPGRTSDSWRNRSVRLRPALPVVLVVPAEDATELADQGVGSVHCPTQSGASAAFRRHGLSKPAPAKSRS